jgi:ZIP family zinc transporter
MSDNYLLILAVAGIAAVASPIGGLLALWHKPSSLFMSVALGFAGGVLLGTISFKMIPEALRLSSLMVAVGGFILGFLSIYAFDLFVHRGKVAGPKAEQEKKVQSFYRRHRPRGDEVTVLAGGTSTEELIEGLSIGVGTSIRPGVGLLIALAIVIDNAAEALSIGELILAEKGGSKQARVRRVLKWAGLIGVSLFGSALVGWYLLRDMSPSTLGFLFSAGGGGMFYLTITDLIPEAEERHFQQSGGLAAGAGFIIILVLSMHL